MKIVVYLVMFLLIDPLIRVAGVALTALYLLAMVVLGVVLLVRGSGRRQSGPQQPGPPVVYGYGGPPVYVVAPTTPLAHPSVVWGATPSAWGSAPLAAPLADWFGQRRPALNAAPRRVPPGGAPLWVHEGQR